MRFALIVLFLLSFVAGCVSEKEYEEVKEENARLKAEIEELKYGADRAYQRATSLLDSESPNDARSELEIFLTKYPEHLREERFKELLSRIDSEIARSERQRKLEEKRIAEEKERKERELNRFISKKYDDFQKITWYETKRNTDYEESPYVTYQVEIYIGSRNDDTKFFRLRTRYTDRHSDYHDTQWIFYERIHLLADNGKEIVVKTDYPAKQSDNDRYGLTEWSDNLLSESDVLAFETAKRIKVRFDGKYRNEFTMTSNQLKAFKEITERFKSH